MTVLVTYAAPLHFLSSDHWIQIRASLSAQLPLNNVELRLPSRTSNRTIGTLDVKLVGLDSLRDEAMSQIPTTLLERPLLNIYVVACDDNEAYKNTVKKQIKDWHATVSQRKNQEWLIISVVRSDGRVSSGGFSKLRGTVLDKIRSDFNSDKRDRCALLNWSNTLDSASVWSEVVEKIKDGVSFAFVSAVSQREEEVRRSETQRQMPGWNFCTFFILKETLATSFEGMCLYEDAKIQYDELEASFFQVLKEKNLSFFGKIIEPHPTDDSSSFLSTTKKPYRDLILANAISLFDFRIYLVAQQCNILARLGRFGDMCIRVCVFLCSFADRLREAKDSLPSCFIESWIYSAAIDTADRCGKLCEDIQLEKQSAANIAAAKGQLLELARQQLDRLGVRLAFLPREPPFHYLDDLGRDLGEMSSSNHSIDKIVNINRISNVELIGALSDKSSFYDLYGRLTKRAIDLYTSGGRRKCALRLHGGLAALEFHRGNYSNSQQTYISLSAHYSPHHWRSLESFMLYRGITSQVNSGTAKDKEWLHTAFSFLKSFAREGSSQQLLSFDDAAAYNSKLLHEIRQVCSSLTEDMVIEDHPAISVLIDKACEGRCAETRDGVNVDVVLINHLPCSLLVDEITISVSGRESEEGIFSVGETDLKPGRNVVTLFCPAPLQGTYMVETRTVRYAKILFQYPQIRGHKRQRSIKKIAKASHLIFIPKDDRALDIVVRQSLRVQVGVSMQLLVTLKTGRNNIQECSISLSSPFAQFSCSQVVKDSSLPDDDGCTVNFRENAVVLNSIDQDKTLSFLLPYTLTTGVDSLKVRVETEYVTTAESAINRKLVSTRSVLISLPIKVNVEDHFRHQRLLSVFTISATTSQHINVRSVKLLPSDEIKSYVEIRSPPKVTKGATTVTPAQSASFMFQIEKEANAIGLLKESLFLHITYRLLREEVEDYLHRSVTALSAEPSFASSANDVQARVIRALESDASWIEHYEVTGELIIPAIMDPGSDLTNEIDRLRTALQPNVRDGGGEWREAIIPLDFPDKSILTIIHMSLNSFPDGTLFQQGSSIFAGQPVPATISVHSSFHWSSTNDDSIEYHMRFEIDEPVKDWLIGGEKRGDFVATDNATWTTAVTLIALRHGELPLPKVHVHLLPSPAAAPKNSPDLPTLATHQAHAAERVLILPNAGRTTFVISDDGT